MMVNIAIGVTIKYQPKSHPLGLNHKMRDVIVIVPSFSNASQRLNIHPAYCTEASALLSDTAWPIRSPASSTSDPVCGRQAPISISSLRDAEPWEVTHPNTSTGVF